MSVSGPMVLAALVIGAGFGAAVGVAHWRARRTQREALEDEGLDLTQEAWAEAERGRLTKVRER